MRKRLFFCAIAAMTISLPLRAQESHTVTICNDGDARISVARVIYTEALLFGNSYRASGWYVVDPDKCGVVYDSADGEPAYFGFAYRDMTNALRTYAGRVRRSDTVFGGASEQFCVSPGVPFDYKTPTKDGLRNCQPGFEALEFSVYFSPSSEAWHHETINVNPDKTYAHGAMIGRRAGATARLIFGDEIRHDGTQWRYANGTALPESLIPKTGLPPLAS